ETYSSLMMKRLASRCDPRPSSRTPPPCPKCSSWTPLATRMLSMLHSRVFRPRGRGDQLEIVIIADSLGLSSRIIPPAGSWSRGVDPHPLAAPCHLQRFRRCRRAYPRRPLPEIGSPYVRP